MTVSVTVSLLAAIGVTGAQAVGERWTDPLLVAGLVTAGLLLVLTSRPNRPGHGGATARSLPHIR